MAAICRFRLSLRREQHQSLLVSTFRREGPKPGRNDRCSCGNGKKSKKRCGVASNVDRLGHLLESFVVQQLMAQAGWTDPDLRFWHYRDKDQVEVDLVITRGRATSGVEVKAAATLAPSDGQGLRRLAEQCGRHFRGGMILHAGASILPTANSRVLAVPLSELWTR